MPEISGEYNCRKPLEFAATGGFGHLNGMQPRVPGTPYLCAVNREVLVFSGCNSHPATGSLQPVAIGAAVEPIVPPSAAPSRPVNSGLGDLVLIATFLYS